MDTPSASPAPKVTGSPALNELPAKGADMVDTLVDLIRNKTVKPLTLVARVIVFGLIVLTAAMAMATLFAISFVRLLTVYAFEGRVWISDLAIGGVFAVLGFIAWTRRRSTAGA